MSIHLGKIGTSAVKCGEKLDNKLDGRGLHKFVIRIA
jgi:hypothetical protein